MHSCSKFEKLRLSWFSGFLTLPTHYMVTMFYSFNTGTLGLASCSTLAMFSILNSFGFSNGGLNGLSALASMGLYSSRSKGLFSLSLWPLVSEDSSRFCICKLLMEILLALILSNDSLIPLPIKPPFWSDHSGVVGFNFVFSMLIFNF